MGFVMPSLEILLIQLKKKKAMEKMKTCLCLVTKMSWVPGAWGDKNIFILFLKA